VGTEIIQVRPDTRSDPHGARLSHFFAAHLRLERKIARRVQLVHALALLALPLLVCIAMPSLHAGLRISFALFAAALAAVVWALCDEYLHRIAVRQAAAGVDVTTLDPPG
jgi:hypothetical protein